MEDIPEISFEDRSSWAGTSPSERAKDPLIGTTLHDTYVIHRVIGEGGMGRVYEARHTRIQTKRYAIKVLHSEFSLDPGLRVRFQREAEAAATIEHDGVVGTYDLGQTPQGWPYMVCEYLTGKDLNDYLKERGPLPASTVVHIGRRLCGALGAAHTRGVIHRDLKPHNIFVLQEHESISPKDGQSSPSANLDLPAVKVLDFGLSRFVESDSELTKTGIILGTPGYMAPEQANGLETDLRTDLYGIGALLFASATGRAPFKESTPQLTVLAVMSRHPPRPRELVSSVPEDLEIVIQKAMAREPSERYQSAAEMEVALSRLHAASDQVLRPGAAAQNTRPSATRARLSMLLAGGVLLGGLSLTGSVLALLEIKGIDYASFSPSVLEWSLFLLLTLFLLFPIAATLRRFKSRIWDNSARVAELLPLVRKPAIAALLGYGLSALILRLAAGIEGLSIGRLASSDVLSTVVWYVVLPINAAFAASSVLLRDLYLSSKSPTVRVFTGTGYSFGALGAGLCLLALAFAWRPQGSSLPKTTTSAVSIPAHQETTSHKNSPSSLPEKQAPQLAAPFAKAPGEETKKTPAKSPSAEFASNDDLAIAVEDGAEALEALAKQYPQDSEVLKALVLAHASRADTLKRSVFAIARLLEIEQGFNKDVDVLFILNKALRTKGSTSDAASSVLKKNMGTEGADLLYQVMSEHPEERKRLTPRFHELRKAKLASQQVLIAYDLKYATSCKARLKLLDRSEKYGDRRSLRQLQALSIKPKRCGGWGRTCYAPCKAEAKRFQRSAKKISTRLAAAKQ